LRRFLLVLLGLATLLVGGVAPAWAATTVGDTSGVCNGWLANGIAPGYITGVGNPGYAFPTAGTVTSWSFTAQGGPSDTGTAQLKIFRPLGGSSYRVIGQSAVEAHNGGLHTYNTSIPVKAGDVIGVEELTATTAQTGACGSLGTGTLNTGGNPQPGDVVTPTAFILRPMLSATVGASTGSKKVASIPQVDHVFLCYSKFQTDPGVWESSTAALLLKAGYWLPYALSGKVDGATNLGDYHLACNLTGTQKPTGGFVDDGGGTWSADYAATTGLYPQAG
jgi:hypothetical protein